MLKQPLPNEFSTYYPPYLMGIRGMRKQRKIGIKRRKKTNLKKENRMLRQQDITKKPSVGQTRRDFISVHQQALFNELRDKAEKTRRDIEQKKILEIEDRRNQAEQIELGKERLQEDRKERRGREHQLGIENALRADENRERLRQLDQQNNFQNTQLRMVGDFLSNIQQQLGATERRQGELEATLRAGIDQLKSRTGKNIPIKFFEGVDEGIRQEELRDTRRSPSLQKTRRLRSQLSQEISTLRGMVARPPIQRQRPQAPTEDPNVVARRKERRERRESIVATPPRPKPPAFKEDALELQPENFPVFTKGRRRPTRQTTLEGGRKKEVGRLFPPKGFNQEPEMSEAEQQEIRDRIYSAITQPKTPPKARPPTPEGVPQRPKPKPPKSARQKSVETMRENARRALKERFTEAKLLDTSLRIESGGFSPKTLASMREDRQQKGIINLPQSQIAVKRASKIATAKGSIVDEAVEIEPSPLVVRRQNYIGEEGLPLVLREGLREPEPEPEPLRPDVEQQSRIQARLEEYDRIIGANRKSSGKRKNTKNAVKLQILKDLGDRALGGRGNIPTKKGTYIMKDYGAGQGQSLNVKRFNFYKEGSQGKDFALDLYGREDFYKDAVARGDIKFIYDEEI